MNTPVPCRLFGLEVLTDVVPHCVHRGAGPIELEIAPGQVAGPDGVESLGPPAMSVHLRHPDGEGQYEVWLRDRELVLKIPQVGVFSCKPGRLEYECLRTVSDEALQWQVFGLIMSGWLEWAGRPVLHGATVEVGGCAAGFLGRSGAGKSSLTLEFLRNGHRVFGDDHLVLDEASGTVCAQPSIPWLKVGPELAHRWGIDHARLPPIHSGANKRCLTLAEGQWAAAPTPMGPLYLLERGWDRPEVVIDPVAPAASLVALIEHSFVPRTVAAAGLAAGRLPILAAAAQQGGVWRLRYPNGAAWLSQVRSAVEAHAKEQVTESPARFRQ